VLLPQPVGPTKVIFIPGSTFKRMSRMTGSP